MIDPQEKSASGAHNDGLTTPHRSKPGRRLPRPGLPRQRVSLLWPADLRSRRHRQPAADLGHRLAAAGRHVPRGGSDWGPQRSAGLLPRPVRMPGLALGVGGHAPGVADGADRLPHGAYPGWSPARPRQARDPAAQSPGASLCRRRYGGESRQPLRTKPTHSAASECPCLHVPGGPRSRSPSMSFATSRA